MDEWLGLKSPVDHSTSGTNGDYFCAGRHLGGGVDDRKPGFQNPLTANDREVPNIAYIYGTKLSPDGTLLLQPSTNGIDVYDGRLGTLHARISLPVSLSQNFDALVGDGKDNAFIAITGQTGIGIAVVDLTSLGEPTPLPYANVHSDLKFASLQGNAECAYRSGNHPPSAASGQPRSTRRIIKHVTNSAH